MSGWTSVAAGHARRNMQYDEHIQVKSRCAARCCDEAATSFDVTTWGQVGGMVRRAVAESLLQYT